MLQKQRHFATSFGNLGVTLGTTIGGWIIVTKGVEYNPWIGFVFGLLAFLMMIFRSILEKKENPAIVCKE